MAVPRFQDFLYPFLSFLKEGDLTKQEMKEKLKEYFSLSEEDCASRTHSGTTTQFNDRIGWSRQWLRRAGLIEIPSRAVYRITTDGREYLRNHNYLTLNELMQIPSFAEYKGVKIGPNPTTPEQLDEKEIGQEIDDLTPTEQLEKAYDSIQHDLAAEILEKVMGQSAAFFEQLVVDLLVKMGYGGSFENSAHVTQLTNDEGIDGIIYEDKLGLDKIYIQAKRWSNPVSRPMIQQFAGALVGQNANKGVFITTSSYSNEARNYVKGIQQKIVLIDGQELAKYMIEYNVGVSVKKEYIIKRIDNDYFED